MCIYAYFHIKPGVWLVNAIVANGISVGDPWERWSEWSSVLRPACTQHFLYQALDVISTDKRHLNVNLKQNIRLTIYSICLNKAITS